MPYAQLNSIESSLEDIVSADAIAVGFIKSEDSAYELVGNISAVSTIEKFFDIDKGVIEVNNNKIILLAEKI